MPKMNVRKADATAADGESLIVESPRKPHYTLAELLAECDPMAPLTDEDRAWLNSTPAGRELC